MSARRSVAKMRGDVSHVCCSVLVVHRLDGVLFSAPSLVINRRASDLGGGRVWRVRSPFPSSFSPLQTCWRERSSSATRACFLWFERIGSRRATHSTIAGSTTSVRVSQLVSHDRHPIGQERWSGSGASLQARAPGLVPGVTHSFPPAGRPHGAPRVPSAGGDLAGALSALLSRAAGRRGVAVPWLLLPGCNLTDEPILHPRGVLDSAPQGSFSVVLPKAVADTRAGEGWPRHDAGARERTRALCGAI